MGVGLSGLYGRGVKSRDMLCCMRMHPRNPRSNVLGPGISPEDLEIAISNSGYPLQSRVVDTILRALEGKTNLRAVQEEWSYVDHEERKVRQLDALLSFEIDTLSETFEPGRPSDPAAYLRGALDFLIECKQSELPFVCFVRSLDVGAFPLIGGLPHEDLTIHMAADDPGVMKMSARDALGVHDLPLAKHDSTAIALTKVHRKGKALELSGEEAFRGLALPILKAASYYLDQVDPGAKRLYFDVRTVIPLAVVDAPLLAVHMVDGKPSLEAVPWIRMVRHEPGERADLFGPQTGSRAFDIVHADFLSEYVELALGSARELIRNARTFAPQLLTGRARWSESLDDSADETRGDEKAPFETLSTHLDDEEFKVWINERWRIVHDFRSDDD